MASALLFCVGVERVMRVKKLKLAKKEIIRRAKGAAKAGAKKVLKPRKTCAFPGCKQKAGTVLSKFNPLCEKHWNTSMSVGSLMWAIVTRRAPKRAGRSATK